MNQIQTPFSINDTVYLKTDPDQHERLVTGIELRGKGLMRYGISFGTSESWHFEFEITTERDVLKATSQ